MKEKLIGTWHLKSWIAFDPKGNQIYPLGEQAKGYIMYTEDGFMSATIMNPDRVSNISTGLSLGTIGSGEGSYLSYAGSYEVKDNIAYHHVEVSCIPEMIGSNQERSFSIADNTLTINSQTPLQNGTKIKHTLIWTKK
ncbi:MAG TPA: hypothetical protein DD381_02345 [Lentisphaeria bacterium]|nr:MAG: hypothetical protein A2X47_08690 [Lentisphaerae bacterium GWF2_38_69]HBM15176.1 hypothetical protein [Lentisphaeria bacterium]